MQITAEQILREAWERQDVERKEPEVKITDEDELQSYRFANFHTPLRFTSLFREVRLSLSRV